MRRYELQLLPWTVAATCMFYPGHTDARRFGLPMPAIREALLTDAGGRLSRRRLWLLPPFGMLTATAMCLRIHRDRIPARFPVHGGLHGRPNGWPSRGPAGVYGPRMFGAILVLFQMCLCVATHRGSRRRTQRSIALAIPTAAACVVAVAFLLVVGAT